MFVRNGDSRARLLVFNGQSDYGNIISSACKWNPAHSFQAQHFKGAYFHRDVFIARTRLPQ